MHRPLIPIVVAVALLATIIAVCGWWRVPSPAADPAALKVETCPFDAIEVTYPPDRDAVHPSPYNSSMQAVIDGRQDPAYVQARDINQDPQFIVAYPERFSVPSNEAVSLRYAGGVLLRGSHVGELRVFDAVSHAEVLRQDYPPGLHTLERRVCRAYDGPGCAYPDAIPIEAGTLAVGVYYAFLTDDRGDPSYPIYFMVRPSAHELSEQRVLVMFPFFTWQAYNRFGGGSLYGIYRFNAAGETEQFQHDQTRLYAVSLDRPMLFDPTGRRHWKNLEEAQSFLDATVNRYAGQLDMLRVRISALRPDMHPYVERSEFTSAVLGWMQRFDESPELSLGFLRLLLDAGIPAAPISSEDLDNDPSILGTAAVLVLTGHDEYWTRTMRERLGEFVRRGGNVANFGGNVLWWQIALEDRTLYQDQDSNARPAVCAPRVPAVFADTGVLGYHIVPGSEAITGVSFRFAGYPIKEYDWLQQQGYEKLGITQEVLDRSDGIVIEKPEHPIFAHLGLSAGQRWGADRQLLSIELDGAPLDAHGNVDRDFSPHFPPDMDVLATATSFTGNRVWNKARDRSHYGVVDSAVVVESRPFGEGGGTVLSFATIGAGIQIGFGDEEMSEVFLRTVRYLDSP